MMRGRYLFGHGGGKPEGKEGEIKITREMRSLFEASPSTTLTPSEHPRDEKPIRSVPEYDESPVKRRGFDAVIRQIAPSVPLKGTIT